MRRYNEMSLWWAYKQILKFLLRNNITIHLFDCAMRRCKQNNQAQRAWPPTRGALFSIVP